MLLKVCVLNICLTLIILTAEVQASTFYIKYEKAKEVWDKRKCIFPDPAIYKDTSSFLEQCNATNNHSGALNSVQIVCETFFRLSIQMCYATADGPPSVTSKLRPEAIGKALDFSNDDVCHYASNLNVTAASNLEELQNSTQCRQLCLNSDLKTKPICELLISALCSFFGKNHCQPAKKKDIAEPTTVVNLTNSTSPAPDTTTEVTTVQVLESEKTTTPADSATEALTEKLPPIVPTQTEKVILDHDNDKGGNDKSEPTKKEKEVDKTDLPVSNVDKPKSGSSKKQGVDPNETVEEAGGKDTIYSVGKEGDNKGKEEDNIGKEKDNKGKEGDNKGKEGDNKGKEEDNKGKEGDNKGKEEDNKGKEEDNEGNTDTSKDADRKEDDIVGYEDSGISDEVKKHETRKKVENSYINPQTTGDDEESNGSGHFLAYFLTAVVICIAGYIIFHNKQKIMAFVIEGRSSHSGRQRSKGVKYTELKSNVEEVLPSLEKSATAKNFVY